MFDITTIPQRRTRTREVKDASGKRVRTKEDYWGVRPVTVVMGFERFSHFFVDALIVAFISNGVGFAWAQFAASGVNIVADSTGVAIGLSFMLSPSGIAIGFAYYAFFEWKFASTPGKMLFKRTVLMKRGTPPDVQTALVRSLTRFIPFEAFSCFGERGWHDRFSDTYVVSKTERDAIVAALAEANQKAQEQSKQQNQS